MARPLRIDLPDGICHVTSRGLERRAIVRDDLDRDRWGRLLGDVAVWLSRALTRASIGGLGAHYGGVSGSAVSHIVRRVDRRRAQSRPFRKQLGELEREIRHDSSSDSC